MLKTNFKETLYLCQVRDIDLYQIEIDNLELINKKKNQIDSYSLYMTKEQLLILRNEINKLIE